MRQSDLHGDMQSEAEMTSPADRGRRVTTVPKVEKHLLYAAEGLPLAEVIPHSAAGQMLE